MSQEPKRPRELSAEEVDAAVDRLAKICEEVLCKKINVMHEVDNVLDPELRAMPNMLYASVVGKSIIANGVACIAVAAGISQPEAQALCDKITDVMMDAWRVRIRAKLDAENDERRKHLWN